MAEPDRPRPSTRAGVVGWRDWWTLLHPPYTLWHLSYVVLGAALARRLSTGRRSPRRSWRSSSPSASPPTRSTSGRAVRSGPTSLTVSWCSSRRWRWSGRCALGVYGAFWCTAPNWLLAAAVPVGVALVVGYNLELAGGRLHNDLTFGLGWGGFPVVVGYLAQDPGAGSPRGAAAVAATCAAIALTHAQRRLSTPARDLRRRTTSVAGSVHRVDGVLVPLDRAALLAPLEGALRSLSWAVPLVALTVLLTHA